MVCCLDARTPGLRPKCTGARESSISSRGRSILLIKWNGAALGVPWKDAEFREGPWCGVPLQKATFQMRTLRLRRVLCLSDFTRTSVCVHMVITVTQQTRYPPSIFASPLACGPVISQSWQSRMKSRKRAGSYEIFKTEFHFFPLNWWIFQKEH